MSAEGWIRLDAGALERLANIAVCVAGKWGAAGETISAPAGRARVEVRVGVPAPVLLRGALIIEAFVEPGRLTTLRLPPF
jgi:hypothetical protein